MIAQETARGQDHAGLAEAALRNVFLKPCPLARMTRVARKPFDRDEAAPFRFSRWDLTRAYRFPILENRARSANADAAPKFRPGHRKRIAQHPDERRVFLDVHDAFRAVDGNGDFAHGDRGSDEAVALR